MQIDKALIIKEMKTWLNDRGYPQCQPDEFVIQSLPELFNMLLEKNLVTVEMEHAFHDMAGIVFTMKKAGVLR